MAAIRRRFVSSLPSSNTPSPSSLIRPLSSSLSSSSSISVSLLPSLSISSTTTTRLSNHHSLFSSSLHSLSYSSSSSVRSFSSSADNKNESNNNNNNNNNQSSSTPSSSSSSSSPSSSSSSFDFVSFLRSEADHIREFANKKFGIVPRKKKRSLEEFRKIYEEEVKNRDKELKKQFPASKDGSTTKATKSTSGKEEEKKNDRKELILTEEKLTVWERRWKNFRSKIEDSRLINNVKGASRKVASVDNVVIRDVKQTLEEAKELWDSQDPIIGSIRSVGDKLFGETETGYAFGEALKRDPSFSLLDFMEEMEYYFAPIVVEAWRKGDLYLLDKISEGQAKAVFKSSVQARAKEHVKWDERVVDMGGFDFTGATVKHDTPVFTFFFLSQHIDHVMSLIDDKFNSGTPYSIGRHYYVFGVIQDQTNPLFDYKIVEFYTQAMKELESSSKSSKSSESSASSSQ